MEDQDLPAHGRRVVQLSLCPTNETRLRLPGRRPRAKRFVLVALDVRAERERGPEEARQRRFHVVAVWHDPRWKAVRVHRSGGGFVTVFRRVEA